MPYATNDHLGRIDAARGRCRRRRHATRSHETIVADALAAGKHVVCEKPLAADLAAVDRLVDLEQATPVGSRPSISGGTGRRSVDGATCVDEGRLGRLVLGQFQRFARLPAGTTQPAGGGAGTRRRRCGDDPGDPRDRPDAPLVRPADIGAGRIAHARRCRSRARTRRLRSCTSRAARWASSTVSVATHDATTRFDVIGDDAELHLPWRITAATSGSGDSSSPRRRRSRRSPACSLVRGRPGPQQAATTSHRGSGRRRRRRCTSGTGRRSPTPSTPASHCPIGPLEARRSVELVTAIYTAALEDGAVTLPLEPDATYSAWRDDRRLRPAARSVAVT